jgi:endoglucanase
MRLNRLILLGACLGLAPAACFSGDDSGGGTIAPLAKRTCKVKETPQMAPGGYYSQGASVCTADGKPHIFEGVDRPSLEWSSTGQFSDEDFIPPSDFQAMANWHANVVRIATNQDFWLSGSGLYAPNYSATIAQAVQNAEAAGLDVILDLHWSDCGNLGVSELAGQNPSDTKTVSGQQVMADVDSIQFWKEVATMFKDDGHVLFELYNEPNTVPWSEWLSGGSSVADCPTVGMQALYDAVRGTGAQNMVIVGGLSWAFDLSEVQSYPIAGAYNLMYATHPYSTNDSETEWPGSFGYLAAGNIAPVIATEFGSSDCTGQWDTDLINFASANQMSWTAWAWFPGGCSFPSLLDDWSYDASAAGMAVQMALAKQPVPAPIDGGTDGAALDAAMDVIERRDGAHDARPQDAHHDGPKDLDVTRPDVSDTDASDGSSDGPTQG